ncbi:MAG TPA: amidohydrolase family protein [Draconibacterium sp.]|nr:amidohydrolase family protein [Draconibacterium sp.]
MRKIAATYIFTNSGPPVKNGILICKNDGTVTDIIKRDGSFTEEAGTEFYSGILVPGFVNAHCHLELSHLQNKITPKTGFGDFLKKINQQKNNSTNQKKAMQIADRKMWAAGIAAVGDVSNSEISLQFKAKGKCHYHTFIEVFGFHPSRAERAFNQGKALLESFNKAGLPASIVPHSPYSVSHKLFALVEQHALQNSGIISMHNQESQAEDEFFKAGTGNLLKHFKDNLKLETSHWKSTGKSSIQSVLRFLQKENKLLLVHNTFIEQSDIEVLRRSRDLNNIYFVLCPNSNLFVQDCLPPFDLLHSEKLNICLGTDSLASNNELSILKEMLTIQQRFNELTLEELVRWSSINGARALSIEEFFGSFEPGKNPGVNLITGIDFKTMKLTDKAKVKRLV